METVATARLLLVALWPLPSRWQPGVLGMGRSHRAAAGPEDPLGVGDRWEKQ